MAGPTVAFAGPGNHASRPAADSGAVFYRCTEHGKIYRSDGTTWSDWLTDPASVTGSLASVQLIIDGGGATIATGVKGYIEVPFAWTNITAGRLLADQSGSIVVDVWKDTYANYPPVDADSITASAPLTISSATKSQDTTLTGWTKTGSAGDILGFNVDSATTVQRVTVALTLVRA